MVMELQIFTIKKKIQRLTLIIPVNIRYDEDIFRLYFQKTSSRRIQDVLIKTNIFLLIIRLQVVLKTFARRLQEVFKASCKMSSRHLKDVFKTSSRHLQDALEVCLQDVFKRYHQVKLFLLTRFQDVFETYSKHFSDVLQRWLSI